MNKERPILFFDGICNLCNGAVQFVIKRDKEKKFLFASLQSLAGKKAILDNMGYGPNVDSMLLFIHNRYYIKSSAFLHVLQQLGGMWKLCAIGFLIPRFVRDRLYDWVAKNRYRWFGKRNECMMPTDELKSRFITG